MKCTPQKTLGHLVVVRQDDRVALRGEGADLVLELADVVGAELTGDRERGGEGHGAERSRVFDSRA
jgi:hypothetical protein